MLRIRLPTPVRTQSSEHPRFSYEIRRRPAPICTLGRRGPCNAPTTPVRTRAVLKRMRSDYGHGENNGTVGNLHREAHEHDPRRHRRHHSHTRLGTHHHLDEQGGGEGVREERGRGHRHGNTTPCADCIVNTTNIGSPVNTTKRKVIPKTGVRCDCSAIPYYKKGKLELVVQHLRPIAEEAPQA